ncbi:MAG: RNA methyltransferase [Candidatus Binataceae bacterium]
MRISRSAAADASERVAEACLVLENLLYSYLMSSLRDSAFILVKPKASGNAGAAARALKNMGFHDLRVVAPREWDGEAARVMAVHADDILNHARFFDTLADAVQDRTLTVATTCRSGPYRSEVRLIREAAPDLAAAAATNRLAIVFGPEDYGLSNEEIGQCHRLVTIPTAGAYPSLNLAQAVIVIAYELMLAAGAARPIAPPAEFAPARETELMLVRMAEALRAIGFLSAENSDHMMLTLRAMLGRSGLHPREVDVLNGIARQIQWFAEGGREVIEAKRASGQRIR